jgi:hypothetical protein
MEHAEVNTQPKLSDMIECAGLPPNQNAVSYKVKSRDDETNGKDW